MIQSVMSPPPTIRLLVVDDHTLFRRALTALLGSEPGLEVVGDAADAGEAQRKAERLQPDVILLDNHLPGVAGVQAIPALLEACPHARVIMLTVSEDEQDLAAALRAGAAGYLLKQIRGSELVDSIRSVASGVSLLPPEVVDATLARLRTPPEDPFRVLTGQERKVLDLISEGRTNRQIADELGLAEKTIKNYVSNMLAKLGLHSRTEAATMAVRLEERRQRHPGS